MNATIKIVSLPKTFAAIRREFPGKSNAGLRQEIRDAAYYGSVTGIKRRVALTGCGVASLDEVQAVLDSEYRELGYDRVEVGEGDPYIYGQGVTVAYLDQPLPLVESEEDQIRRANEREAADCSYRQACQ